VTITDKRTGIRRSPRQERSRQTVEAVLDAVERVLKRDGVDAITTNRIAEAAGVSIGSVYQYFPDKQSIFTALHRRHVEQVRQVIEHAVAEHASSSLEDFACSLVEGLLDVHAVDPQLHAIIEEAVPESSPAFRRALHATFERVTPDRILFVLPHLIEALVHGGMTRRPPSMSLDEAKREAVRAVRAYLSAARGDSP
jgi:AcrR family transcriptional regulator